ncbi:MAG TPA: translation initiation factor [Dissulfurispiraceae bacterium]|nr:translation initiation factor [Dissulfurispiraceae bacterium]
MRKDNNRTVFSTDHVIKKKSPLVNPANSVAMHSKVPASQQRVIVCLEKKSRGGKSVTLIEGLQLPTKDSEAMLKQLKSRLGTGGALKERTLELQGDRRDQIIAFLETLGYRPKRSGG